MKSSNTLPMSRLAPAAPHGRDAITLYLLAASAGLALAFVWLAFSAVRPLVAADADPASPVVEAPTVEFDPMRTPGRQAIVEELTAQNYFAFGRGEWVDRPSLAQANTTKDDPAPAPAVAATASDSRVVNSRGEVLNVAEKGDATGEFKKALDNIDLRGLFADASGTEYAMIWRKHEEKAGRTTSFAVGEEFVEQKAGGAPWRVEHIDMEIGRVAVSRDGEAVWLNLRERSLAFAPNARMSNAFFDPATSVPVVEQITMDELRRALVLEGLSADEVNAYIQTAEQMDPEREAKVKGLVDAVKQINQPGSPPEAEGPKPAGATPEDIQTLLEMMANNIPPTPEMLEKFNNPQPSEPK